MSVIKEIRCPAWVPQGWDEPSPPCEIRFVQSGHRCDNSAEVAFRMSCCGFVKQVCSVHWDYLTLGGVSDETAHVCAGCQKVWGDFRKAMSNYWRI